MCLPGTELLLLHSVEAYRVHESARESSRCTHNFTLSLNATAAACVSARVCMCCLQLVSSLKQLQVAYNPRFQTVTDN